MQVLLSNCETCLFVVYKEDDIFIVILKSIIYDLSYTNTKLKAT